LLEAVGAVGRDAEGGATGQRQVIRQAWMRNRDVIGGNTVAGRQFVDIRSVRVADYLVITMVFHDDDEDVVKRRHQWLRHPDTLTSHREAICRGHVTFT
jgi:hypothetical protein